MKFCVQWAINCDTNTNADNCLEGINNAINAITSGWENERNKNRNLKSLNHIENKWRVSGVHRMSDETERNHTFDVIKGLLHAPQIMGKVYWHRCTHDEDSPTSCVIEEIYEG